MTPAEKQLIDFLRGDSKDVYGRFIDNILNKNHNILWLELTHNYIQWLFPLKEKSNAAYSVPLTDEMVEIISNDNDILTNIKKAFAMMLHFYGFHLDKDTDEISILKSKSWMMMHWLNPYNHNFLRITRILSCLCICEMSNLAKKWLALLEEITKDIPYCNLSKEYWREAVK